MLQVVEELSKIDAALDGVSFISYSHQAITRTYIILMTPYFPLTLNTTVIKSYPRVRGLC